VSLDLLCYDPPAACPGGEVDPARQTNNPGAHLDICPWSYLPRPGRRRDPDCDADEFRYERGLYDFRGEINAVRGEENHHQGLINLVDNREEDGGTALVPGFHERYEEWSLALGEWRENRVGQRRRGAAYV
jgi:hypothetical protein